jgi:hypothetical protein
MSNVGVNDLLVTWDRRDRLGDGTAVDDTYDIPMSEAAERYDLEILNGSAIVRTVTGIAETQYIYSASNQTDDGFSPPLAELKFNLYQTSENIGRGFQASKTVTVGVP